MNEGWLCSKCNTMWAPNIKSCENCSKPIDEKEKDDRQLLNEYRIAMPQTFTHKYTYWCYQHGGCQSSVPGNACGCNFPKPMRSSA